MKALVILGLALATALPSSAQLFSRDALGTAVVGGILGGVIGHNSGRKTAEGIGIGAGTGLLLGALANDYKRQSGWEATQVPEPTAFGGNNNYRYTTTGAVLGGIAGGVIGHNNGRKTAEGVAIGAASGAVLGVIADQSRQQRPANFYHAPVAAYPAPAVTEPLRPFRQPHAVPAVVTTPVASGYVAPVATTSTAPIQAQTVIINNYYGGSPMAPANALFGR